MPGPCRACGILFSGLVLVFAAGCGDHDLVMGPELFSSPRVWRVPADVPTIQQAISLASSGDTVVVAPGVYGDCNYGDPTGQRCCVILRSGICLRSETGDPDCATLDARSLGRVIYCGDLDATAVIEGFTITGGLAGDGKAPPTPAVRGGGIHCVRATLRLVNCILTGHKASTGGAIYCESASVTLERCDIRQNRACYYDGGGGLSCVSSSLALTRCTLVANRAFAGGGISAGESSTLDLDDCIIADNRASYGAGIFCIGSSAALDFCTFAGNRGFECGGGACFGSCAPVLTHCTLAGNAADQGGGVYCDMSSPHLDHTLIAFGAGGGAVFCEDFASTPVLSGCNIYGNVGGDWTGLIAGQAVNAANLSEDPMFCDPEGGDFHLDADSPCAGSGTRSFIGAWGVGCGR